MESMSSGLRARQTTTSDTHVATNVFGQCECRLCALNALVTQMIDEERPTRLDVVREIVRNHLTGDIYRRSTEVSLFGLIEQFWSWCNDAEIKDVLSIEREHVEAFLHTPVKRGEKFSAPKPKTIDNRLWAVERVYEALRYFGYKIPDPTQDILVALDRRIVSAYCTDDEVASLREAVPSVLFDDSYAVILALAEVGATNSEMRELKTNDLDIERGLVRLPGGSRNDSRINELTSWGREALKTCLPNHNAKWLVVNTLSQTVSEQTISQRFRELVANAKLSRRGVNINSVRAWRARQIYETSGRIQDAARFLGYRSLDTAVEMIGLDWRTEH
ncbi:MAG: hypothetical protein EBZ52_00490 [Actinobacteria bacterium]|nr:hypothetical protein [Actinomycetota bacterium]